MSESSTPGNLPPVRPRQNPYGEQPGMNPYAAPLAYPPPPPQDDHALRWIIPVGTSGWAIASGYCGLLSLAACFLGPVAIFCGIMAIRETSADPNLSGLGRAIFGIITGALGSISLGFFLFFLLTRR